MNSQHLASAYAHCGEALRAGNRDEWLACLFAPPDKRLHLQALYAFANELGSLRDKISQPMAGEIRLQYWRDALEGRDHGGTQANPLASALLDTITRCRLPLPPFLALIDARLFDVYDDPMPDVAALEAYGGETRSAIIRLTCLILAGGNDPGGADACGHAGVALAIAGIFRGLPRDAARGQVFLPGDILQRAGLQAADIVARRDSPALRSALTELRILARCHAATALGDPSGKNPDIALAFLLLPVAEMFLRASEKPGYHPFESPLEIPQWRRQWVMWLAARRTG